MLPATNSKRRNAAQERFLIAGRKLLGDARRLRKKCFFVGVILKSKFGVGQRQGVVGPVRGRRRWLDGVTVPGMSRSGQLQLPRQWRLIRDSVLEPVSAPVGDDTSLFAVSL